MRRNLLKHSAMKALLCMVLCAVMLLAPFTGNAVTSMNSNVAFTDEGFSTYNLAYRAADSQTRSVAASGFNVRLDIDGTPYFAHDEPNIGSVPELVTPIIMVGFAIKTPEGQAWLQTDAGKEWMKIPQIQELMKYRTTPAWMTTAEGKAWLQTILDKRGDGLLHPWIHTPSPDYEKWITTPEYKTWISKVGSNQVATEYINWYAYEELFAMVGDIMTQTSGTLDERLGAAAFLLTIEYITSLDFLRNPYTFDGVTLEMKSELLDDQASVKVMYQLSNTASANKSVTAVTDAFLGIFDAEGNELASNYAIANMPGSTGFVMTGAGAKFTLVAKGNGVTDVSNYWAGSNDAAWAQGVYDRYDVQMSEDSYEPKAALPMMRFAWRNIALAPGETKTYSVIYKMEVTDPVSVQAPHVEMSFETTQGSSEWSNQPISYKLTDTVNTPGDVSKYLVKINDGPYYEARPNVTNTVLEQTGEVTISAIAVSRSGQQSAPVVKYARTDLDKPQVNAVQQEHRQYALSATDVGSGIAGAQYAWGTRTAVTGSYISYSDGNVISVPEDLYGTVYLWLKATDQAGNTVSKKVSVEAGQPTPAAPQITMNHSTDPSSSEWFREAITFTLADSSNPSDIVAGYRYKINDGPWADAKLGETYFALSTTGTVTVTAVAVGKNGQDSVPVTAFSRMDITPPTVTHTALDQNRQLSIRGQDSASGMEYLGYNWTRENNAPASYLEVPAGGTVTALEGFYGSGYLWVKAIDRVGNETVESYPIDFGEAPKAPAIAPQILLSFETTPDTDAWSRMPVTFQITDDLNVPGTIKQYQYKLGNGAWTNAKPGETYTALNESGSATVIVRCISIDDVVSEETKAFTRMDMDAPIVGLQQNKLIATDAHSGIAAAQYAFEYIWDNPSGTAPTAFQGTYQNGDPVKVPDGMKGVGKVNLWLKATDQAGNETIEKFEYDTGILALADPVLTTNFPASGWITGDAVFTITDPGNHAAVMEKYQYQIDGGAWTDAALDKEYTVPAQGSTVTIRVKGISKFGTETAVVCASAKVDNASPVVGAVPSGDERTVKISVSDALSGLASAGYAWSASGTEAPASFADCQDGAVIGFPKGVCGTYYLWLKAADQAGNEVIKAFEIDLPEVPVLAPALHLSFTTTPGSGEWAKEAVTLTITDTQNPGANVYQYFYRIGEGEWIPAQLNIEYTALSASGTAFVSVKALSVDGKTYSDVVSLYTQADLDAPAVNAIPNEEKSELTLSVLDLHSGIAAAQYAWSACGTEAPEEYLDFVNGDKLPLPQESEEASYLWVKTVDHNGNQSIRVVYTVAPKEEPPVVDPDDPTPPDDPDTPSNGNTGVDSNTFAWILLAALSSLFAAVFVFAKKKARA